MYRIYTPPPPPQPLKTIIIPAPQRYYKTLVWSVTVRPVCTIGIDKYPISLNEYPIYSDI